jgi:hypothetical protein
MSRVAKLVALVVVVVAIAAVAWLLLRSGDPTAFASGKRVDLADFTGANPTGVPPSLAQADPVARKTAIEEMHFAAEVFHGLFRPSFERSVRAGSFQSGCAW